LKFEFSTISTGLGKHCLWSPPTASDFAFGAQSLPDFQPMHGNVGIDFKTKRHFPVQGFQNGDFEQAQKAAALSDHYCFPILP
jgi:hypothetical protein